MATSFIIEIIFIDFYFWAQPQSVVLLFITASWKFKKQ